jgi:hypothetical protein
MIASLWCGLRCLRRVPLAGAKPDALQDLHGGPSYRVPGAPRGGATTRYLLYPAPDDIAFPVMRPECPAVARRSRSEGPRSVIFPWAPLLLGRFTRLPGTETSNLCPSSGESGENLIFGAESHR